MQSLSNKDEFRIMKKILILGPLKAGKTTLATFLGEYMGDEFRKDDEDSDRRNRKMELEFTSVYRPTKGVRVVEFESHEFLSREDRNDLNQNGMNRMLDVEIQLWDVSGDKKYQDCWPAIKESVDGVILIANPEVNTGSDLLDWYQEFVEKENLTTESVIVMLNEQGPKKTNHELVSAFKIEPQLRGVPHVACHFGTEGMMLKNEINSFLVKILLQNNSNNLETKNIMEPLSEEESVEENRNQNKIDKDDEDMDDF